MSDIILEEKMVDNEKPKKKKTYKFVDRFLEAKPRKGEYKVVMDKQSMKDPKPKHQGQALTQPQKKESKLSGHMLIIRLIQITNLQVQKMRLKTIIFSKHGADWKHT